MISCIFNEQSNAHSCALHSTQSPRELIFSPYTEHDIRKIIELRIGTVIDPKALQLISRRIAYLSGDARRALEVTSDAVENCLNSLTKEELDRELVDECMPLVKLTHVMRAIKSKMPTPCVDLIAGLPLAAKVILCIAVTLCQVWGPKAEISISELRKYCIEATHHSILDDGGSQQIMSLVDMLVDYGLLRTCNNRPLDRHDSNPKLRLVTQLDDVEIALETSLFNNRFYKNLADYVRREYPLPDNS